MHLRTRTVHLHGAFVPWISDGTRTSGTTLRAKTRYPRGVSVYNVPDMEDAGQPPQGVLTFYYNNQQSARLQFYHDHAWGITCSTSTPARPRATSSATRSRTT